MTSTELQLYPMPEELISATPSALIAPIPQGKLLIVEDDQNIQRMIADYFKHVGFDVVTANDGEAGIKAALDEKPDALILDVMLPKTDGFSVCRHIRERNPSLPILILTAKDDVVDKVLGLEMGADDYITKPFSLARTRSPPEKRPAPYAREIKRRGRRRSISDFTRRPQNYSRSPRSHDQRQICRFNTQRI